MTLVYALFLAAVLVPAVGVPVAAARLVPLLAAHRRAARLRDAAAAVVHALGVGPSAVVVLLAGSAAVVAVCWPLGEALSRLEHTVDERVFSYVTARRVASWEALDETVTVLGDRSFLMIVVGVAAAVFAVLWRRRWWIPVLAMTGQFLLEQYTQTILAVVVDRGHPPTDLGTYPSGGCARVLMTFGTIAMLAALTWRLPRAVRIALATVVAVAASLEGYTRIYTQKHWLTDVIGGWIFGALLLGVVAVALTVATGRRGTGRRGTAAPSTVPAQTPRLHIVGGGR